MRVPKVLAAGTLWKKPADPVLQKMKQKTKKQLSRASWRTKTMTLKLWCASGVCVLLLFLVFPAACLSFSLFFSSPAFLLLCSVSFFLFLSRSNEGFLVSKKGLLSFSLFCLRLSFFPSPSHSNARMQERKLPLFSAFFFLLLPASLAFFLVFLFLFSSSLSFFFSSFRLVIRGAYI